MSLEAVAAFFLSPLSVVLTLAVAAGVSRLLRQRRLATALATMGFVLLWICSMPIVAHALVARLAEGYPAKAPEAAPNADAIVLLGGAVIGANPPWRPNLELGGAATRVWHAAALYRAGKAPRIVVAAGNRPEFLAEQVEADAITEVLVQLGVPRTAIILERESRTTRENARNTLPILKQLGAKRVLLVTSTPHMARAVKTFEAIWRSEGPQIVPEPADGVAPLQATRLEVWLPSLSAISSVNACLKEFAGSAAVAIIR